MKYIILLLTIPACAVQSTSAMIKEEKPSALPVLFQKPFGELTWRQQFHRDFEKAQADFWHNRLTFAQLKEAMGHMDMDVVLEWAREYAKNVFSKADEVLKKGPEATSAEIENAMAGLKILTASTGTKEGVERVSKAEDYLRKLSALPNAPKEKKGS